MQVVSLSRDGMKVGRGRFFRQEIVYTKELPLGRI